MYRPDSVFTIFSMRMRLHENPEFFWRQER